MIDVNHLTYRYGSHVALNDLTMQVPQGSLFALLGPNGSGKTTLLQILMGLRKGFDGDVLVAGKNINAWSVNDRADTAYIAEGQALPEWMRLREVEAYLAPLYPRWDHALARELREQFELDPERKIGTLSRGQHMKAALLCALAPRPKLLIMDEPFTGMDALVKDELVRGLLQSSGSEGWTVLLCSHDIGELELLADHVGLLDRGQLKLAASSDEVRSRFHRVEVMLEGSGLPSVRSEWLAYEQAGNHATFTVDDNNPAIEQIIAAQLPQGSRIELRTATLREVFVALAKPRRARGAEVTA